MLKKIQAVGNSKSIIIDKKILRELNNPQYFDFKYDGEKIILTPIVGKKPKTRRLNINDFYCLYFQDKINNCYEKCCNDCHNCEYFIINLEEPNKKEEE